MFVNVCQAEQVDRPAPKAKLDADGNEQQGVNVPLSLGPGVSGKDRKGRTQCGVAVDAVSIRRHGFPCSRRRDGVADTCRWSHTLTVS